MFRVREGLDLNSEHGHHKGMQRHGAGLRRTHKGLNRPEIVEAGDMRRSYQIVGEKLQHFPIFTPSRQNSYDRVQRDSQAKGGSNFGRIANRLLPPWPERGVFIFRKSAPSKRDLAIQAIYRRRTHD